MEIRFLIGEPPAGKTTGEPPAGMTEFGNGGEPPAG